MYLPDKTKSTHSHRLQIGISRSLLAHITLNVLWFFHEWCRGITPPACYLKGCSKDLSADEFSHVKRFGML